jgi:hypothetical protein
MTNDKSMTNDKFQTFFDIWILTLICHWKFVICHFYIVFPPLWPRESLSTKVAPPL